jgi:hypothetical protein
MVDEKKQLAGLTEANSLPTKNWITYLTVI